MTAGQFVKQNQCLWLRIEGRGEAVLGAAGTREEGTEDVLRLRRPDACP